MTLGQAIQKARELDWAAGEGWPMGQPEDLIEQAKEILGVIDGYVAGFPVDQQDNVARQVRLRIEAKEYTATVAPRKRRTA